MPFDVAALRVIFFDLTDLDSVADARNAISKQVQIFLTKPDFFETPISLSVETDALKGGHNPRDKILTDVLESVQTLNNKIESISDKIGQNIVSDRSSMFSPKFLQKLRDEILISDVARRKVSLKKAGREWRGLSPFHSEKTPSFYVNDQKQFYHCLSSGKHGDVFTFVIELEQLDFFDAVLTIASLLRERRLK